MIKLSSMPWKVTAIKTPLSLKLMGQLHLGLVCLIRENALQSMFKWELQVDLGIIKPVHSSDPVPGERFTGLFSFFQFKKNFFREYHQSQKVWIQTICRGYQLHTTSIRGPDKRGHQHSQVRAFTTAPCVTKGSLFPHLNYEGCVQNHRLYWKDGQWLWLFLLARVIWLALKLD